MKGAIIGDIIGSIYEFNNYKGSINDLKLFSKYSFFTDDTICSCGICKAIIEKENPSPVDYAKNLWQICRKYPDASYGANFNKWVMSNPPRPYNSFGNGAAMRISSIPYVYRHKENFIEQLINATTISHNHPEGIKGAQVIGQIIAYCIDKKSKEYIKNFAEKQYCLPIVKQIGFNETCQETVPMCISILLDSSSFEEAMKNRCVLAETQIQFVQLLVVWQNLYLESQKKLKNKCIIILMTILKI